LFLLRRIEDSPQLAVESFNPPAGEGKVRRVPVANPVIGPDKDEERVQEDLDRCGPGILEIGSVVW
jgi:hypothetical protein